MRNSNVLGRSLVDNTVDESDLVVDAFAGSARLGESYVPMLPHAWYDTAASMAGRRAQLCSILISPDVDIVLTICAIDATAVTVTDIQELRVTGGAGLHLRDYDRYLCKSDLGTALYAYMSPATANFMLTTVCDIAEVKDGRG